MMRPGQRPVNETRMNVGAARWLLVTIVMLVAAVGCSAFSGPPPIDYGRSSAVTSADLATSLLVAVRMFPWRHG